MTNDDSMGFEFTEQLAEARIVADRVEVLVFAHVAKVAIPEFDRLAQGLQRQFGLFEKGVGASQIVMSQSVARPKLDQPPIDLQPVTVPAFEGQIVAMGAEDVDIPVIEFEDGAEEPQFEIELALFGKVRQRGGTSFGLGSAFAR